MSMGMWLWEAQGASVLADVRVIGARGEAVVEIVIDVTHAVIGTPQILTTPFALLEGTSTVVVGVPALALDPLTVIGTIDPEVDLDVTTKKGSETEAHAVTATGLDDVHLAPSPKSLHHNPLKTSAIEGLSLCSNSQPG